ncbi:MAG: hypothetical protein ACLQJR_18415 [Stellaceae bacterium]
MPVFDAARTVEPLAIPLRDALVMLGHDPDKVSTSRLNKLIHRGDFPPRFRNHSGRGAAWVVNYAALIECERRLEEQGRILAEKYREQTRAARATARAAAS